MSSAGRAAETDDTENGALAAVSCKSHSTSLLPEVYDRGVRGDELSRC